MRIDSIEIRRVSMPLVYPFRTAFGNDAVIESILVCLRSGKVCGWGEATPWQTPGYSPEFAAGAFLALREFLAPRLIGQDVRTGADLQRLLAHVKGNNFAKAALDLAWWDLAARLQAKPLWRLLGGVSPTVDVGADFGIMESVEDLLRTIEGAVHAGFKRIKLKYRPGWDLAMVAAVRQRFPTQVFHVDCNSAYTLADVEMFKQLDRFGLAMIEQPLMHDDLLDHAALQAQLKTPICLDESISSADKARQAIAIKACGWINIKPGRVGGLTNAVAIHNLCQQAGIPCWVGGMLESAVGASHCLALATLPNFKYPADVFPSERFFAPDLSEPPMALCAPSRMRAPATPGCGAEPNADRLEKQTLDLAVWPTPRPC
ncbi:MAG: o-succinylbenzoate synthase [Kiritimatiellae bacterium]|nr:o-succinylbenzoate synthase [Kiritimatiellia bacterium]